LNRLTQHYRIIETGNGLLRFKQRSESNLGKKQNTCCKKKPLRDLCITVSLSFSVSNTYITITFDKASYAEVSLTSNTIIIMFNKINREKNHFSLVDLSTAE